MAEPVVELTIWGWIQNSYYNSKEPGYQFIKRIKNSGQPTVYNHDNPYQIQQAEIFLLPESEDAAWWWQIPETIFGEYLEKSG